MDPITIIVFVATILSSDGELRVAALPFPTMDHCRAAQAMVAERDAQDPEVKIWTQCVRQPLLEPINDVPASR